MSNEEYGLREEERYMKEADSSLTVFILSMLILFFYPIATIFITVILIAIFLNIF